MSLALNARKCWDALERNFGQWIWGDQISLPKTMNVIAAVGTKHNSSVLKVINLRMRITKKLEQNLTKIYWNSIQIIFNKL